MNQGDRDVAKDAEQRRAAGARPAGGATPAAWRTLPASIWVLGLGSLFMDTSSELIHSLLPVFMVSGLGASMIAVGVVEGVAEATAAVLKVFSGALSDRLGHRKWVMVSGYALAALTKPVFPLAPTVGWVFGARFVDRIGKGIRGAPRDALVADITPPRLLGAAYGLRQALDSVGAVAGPLLAMVFMFAFAGNIRAVMWVATVPALLCTGLLAAYVREPEQASAGASRARVSFAGLGRLPLRYWLIVVMGAIFTLARFSEAFLVLRARDVGLGLAYVPVVMIAMNVVYAGAAYPAGVAADRVSARLLLLAGMLLLIAADLVLAFAGSPPAVFAGAALWGLHMALTQGLLSKLVAETVPAEIRGAGFGLFHLVTGGALLLASVIAGALWSSRGASATFLAGAGFAVVATLGLLAAPRRPRAAG